MNNRARSPGCCTSFSVAAAFLTVLLQLAGASPVRAASGELDTSFDSPQTISDPGVDGAEPQVAVDPQGNAIAVWTRGTGTFFNRITDIQTAFRPAGGSFGTPQTISEIDAQAPQVAVDPQGNAVAVWTAGGVQAAFRPAGGSFGTPQTISEIDAQAPQVAVDPQGNAIAVWTRIVGGVLTIEAAFRPASGSFGAPQTVSDPSQHAVLPAVAFDPQGNAIVIWARNDNFTGPPVDRIEVSLRPAGGSFGAPQAISTPIDNATQPQVAFDAQGNAVAVWLEGNVLQAAFRPAGGSFGAPETIFVDAPTTLNPRVAVDAQGNAIAVWWRNEDRVRAAFRPAGGSFGAPQNLSQDPFGREPQVAMNPRGDAVVVWGGTNFVAHATFRPAGGSFGVPQTLSSSFTPFQGSPQVAMDPQGCAVAVWRGGDGTNVRIQAAFTDCLPSNQHPVADAGPDQTLECTSPSGNLVTLNGTGSSDPDGDTLTFSWSGPFGSASGATPTVTLGPGTHIITLTVADGKGGSASNTVTITVQDTTAPSIAWASASPNLLWPPNHKLIPVVIGVSVSDACSTSSTCQIVSVASNEPVNGLGDGDTAPDWQVTGALSLDLRAERSGTGSGRVYAVTLQCSDAFGNSSTTDVTVEVPHDKGK